jgi:hypothetical protein
MSEKKTTKITYYYLKCCIERGNSEITISGSSIWMHILWSDFQMDYICALELKLIIFQL